MSRTGMIMLVMFAMTPPALTGQDYTRAELGRAQQVIALLPHIVERVPSALLDDRPLLIDLRSFVYVGSALAGTDLLPDDVRSAIGRTFVDVPVDSAIIAPAAHRLEVRYGGVHVRLDGLSVAGGVVTAMITYLYTDSRGYSAAVGGAQVLLTFRWRGGEWEWVHEHVLGTS